MTIPGYKAGDRVRFSEKGRNAHRHQPDKVGVVVGQPSRKRVTMLTVRWDGTVTDQQFHPAFIEHELDFVAACAQVHADFDKALAYLG